MIVQVYSFHDAAAECRELTVPELYAYGRVYRAATLNTRKSQKDGWNGLSSISKSRVGTQASCYGNPLMRKLIL